MSDFSRTPAFLTRPAGYRVRVSPRHVPASVTELSRVGLLAALPGETLTKLAERMTREEIPGGRTIVAEGEDARIELRVQRLDAAAHDLGEAGEVLDRPHREAGLLELPRGAARGDDLDAETGAAFTAVTVVQPGALGPEDADEISDDLPPNTSALLIAIENLWAAKVVQACQAADAVMIDQIRIPVDVAQAVLPAG